MNKAKEALKSSGLELDKVTLQAAFWTLAPLLPYMPEEVCNAIPATQASSQGDTSVTLEH